VTIAEILKGKRIDLPMWRMDMVKAAQVEGDGRDQRLLI
jgi:hypothetical protein